MEEGNETAAWAAVDGDTGSEGKRRRRYFVSLIDESIYKKGVFQRLRRRHKVRVVGGSLLFRILEGCAGRGGMVSSGVHPKLQRPMLMVLGAIGWTAGSRERQPFFCVRACVCVFVFF